MLFFHKPRSDRFAIEQFRFTAAHIGAHVSGVSPLDSDRNTNIAADVLPRSGPVIHMKRYFRLCDHVLTCIHGTEWSIRDASETNSPQPADANHRFAHARSGLANAPAKFNMWNVNPTVYNDNAYRDTVGGIHRAFLVYTISLKNKKTNILRPVKFGSNNSLESIEKFNFAKTRQNKRLLLSRYSRFRSYGSIAKNCTIFYSFSIH